MGISEIPSLDVRFKKHRALDFKIIYLPLNHVLTPKDLDLNNNWKIYDYWFDYDQHRLVNQGVLGEKEWQFAVRNVKTKATNTFIASDVEKKLLAGCKITKTQFSEKE